MRVENLGRPAVFLLPSLKLKKRNTGGGTIEDHVHAFLLKEFGGYTVTAGNIFGYWKGERRDLFYGEHRLYSVAFSGKGRIPALQSFLADIAAKMREQCIYLECGEDAMLVYP